jgi:phenylacetate-CoA ligase
MQNRYYDPQIETASRDTLQKIQTDKLRSLVKHAWDSSPFYRRKFEEANVTPDQIQSLEDIAKLPFVTKEDLRKNQETSPPWGDALTLPPEDCQRIHLTSGTTGKPLRILDTAEDWAKFCHIYARNLYAYGIRKTDMAMPAFSFGPWIGFWAGYYACQEIGCLLFASGGMKTEQRIDALLTYPITVLGCTPSYALHMADVAGKQNIHFARQAKIRIAWHTGEPGAVIPGVKEKIEEAYGCKCFDFLGSTEIGPWGFNCEFQSGITHVNEDWAYPEVLDLETDQPVGPGGTGELVLSNLERKANPFLRYRSKDIVRVADRECPCGRTLFALEGSVLSRLDDMKKIRGVIVYPSKIEELVRGFKEVEEFQILFKRIEGLDEIFVRIEPVPAMSPSFNPALKEKVSKELHLGLGIRVSVELVGQGVLPRWDHKAKRVIDERKDIPF